MSQSATERFRWAITDLDLPPDNDLYASQGVQEYWMADRRLQQVQVYRRQTATLKLAATLLISDEINSPLLPSFTCNIATFFR